MLRLLLLRHAKTVPFVGSGDHERALTGRGRADSARLGEWIAKENIAPQAAVHSGARRTKETLALVLAKLPSGIAVWVEPRLYEATNVAFLNVLRHMPDTATTILLVGHNPSLGETACRLAATGDRRALSKMAAKFPTAGLAMIDFDADHWTDIDNGMGRLIRFETPASLDGEGG